MKKMKKFLQILKEVVMFLIRKHDQFMDHLEHALSKKWLPENMPQNWEWVLAAIILTAFIMYHIMGGTLGVPGFDC